MRTLTFRGLRLGGLLTVILGSLVATPAFAGTPNLDSGIQLDTNQPYATAQDAGEAFDNHAVYGKLQGDTPVDIYRFHASRDGAQTISLMTLAVGEQTENIAPALILLDPTSETTAQQLGIPVPSDAYHSVLLKQSTDGKTVTERWLFTKYHVQSEQTLNLKKDTDYYLVVLDSNRVVNHYAIRFGDNQSWTAKDVFTHIGSWFRILTDNYAQTSPFKVTGAAVWGFLILFLGLAALMGTFIVEQILSLMANRKKTAGYLLIKLQPFSRVIIWVALWFMFVGGILFFQKSGLLGIPFVITILFILTLIAFLFQTLSLTPKLMKVEVTKQEAAIPLRLRKAWFFTSLAELLTLLPIIVLLAIFFAGYIKS